MTLRKRNAMNSHPETLLAAVRYFADLDVCDQYMRKIKWRLTYRTLAAIDDSGFMGIS